MSCSTFMADGKCGASPSPFPSSLPTSPGLWRPVSGNRERVKGLAVAGWWWKICLIAHQYFRRSCGKPTPANIFHRVIGQWDWMPAA
ncbi:uncharacterized [Tachysurus ichikawai]